VIIISNNIKFSSIPQWRTTSYVLIDQNILAVATSVDCVVHEAAVLHTAASGFIFEHIKFRLFSLNDVSTIRSLFFMF
jgi:hypothetical protein